MSKETKILQCRGSHPPNIKKFLQEWEEAILDGWTVDEECRAGHNRPIFTPRLTRIPLIKPKGIIEEPPVVEPVSVVEESTEDRSTRIEAGIKDSAKLSKVDLVWFADLKELTIPEDVKVPTAIRKFLKESLEK